MSHFEVFRRLRTQHETVLLAYSGGKDANATLAGLKAHGFEVRPYYFYAVPGLGFVERYLRRMEHHFGVTIAQYPNPSLGDEMQAGWYRQPRPDFPRISAADLREVIRADLGARMIATGQKKCDSLQRRGMISAVNAIDEAHGYAYPLADWNDRDVMSYLRHQRVPLDPSYNADSTGNFGGAITPRWCRWIKATYPEDWQKVLKFYPYAEAALLKPEREGRKRRR